MTAGTSSGNLCAGLARACAAAVSVLVILFLVITPNAGWAQTAAPAPLPSAAQQALDKGIIAAKVPDYPLAIRYFEDARKLAPAAPVIFMNLGIAESKIPGRELRAIAWFGAYLAALPDAPNAAAVKEQIAVLEVRNRSNVSRLIKTAQDLAGKISRHKNGNLRDVAKLWAQAGDIKTALEAADSTSTADWRSATQTDIAEVQITAGDIAGAQETLASAQKSADLIESRFDKSSNRRLIAEAQMKAGDSAGARNTLASALKTADLIKEANYKSNALRTIAETQIKAGDIAGAQKTLESALKTADSILDAKAKTYEQSFIAEAQIKAGDIAGAQKTLASARKTADLIQDAFWKTQAPGRIAEAQAKAGTANAANSTSRLTSNIKSPIRPVITVSDWLKKLDDGDRAGDCPLNTSPFLDLAGHLKSMPPSDNPQEVAVSGLYKTAEKIVTAQGVIHQMLKQQATR